MSEDKETSCNQIRQQTEVNKEENNAIPTILNEENKDDKDIMTQKCVIGNKNTNISKGYQTKKSLEKKWMSKHDFMRWYDVIKDSTFQSLDIAIEIDEAKALVRLYHHRVNKNKPLSTQQQDAINKFKNKIKVHLKNDISFNIDNGFFVRLSSRSPKDATMFEPYLNRTKKSMYKLLKNKIKNGFENDYNTQTIAFFQACVNEMRVYSIDDIINLLCNSERVLIDLNTWIIGYNDDNIFDMKLIIREWKDIIIGSEYRAFVGSNGNLNALCQYYNFLYFPFVVEYKNIISNKIQMFYENELKQTFIDHQNQQLLPCVIDFVLLGQYCKVQESQVFVVELNMFHDYDNTVKISSGSEMFDWNKDKNVLLNGPFEFRINENVCEYKFYKKFINPDWLNIMNAVTQNMENDDKKKKRYIIFGAITFVVLIIAVVCAVLLS